MAELVCETLWGQWVFCVVLTPPLIGCIQIFGAGFIVGLECHITLRIEKVQNVIGIPNCGRDIVLGSLADGNMLVRIAQVLGHLSYSLGQYKEALTKFAERLNEPGYDRTSDGYAAMFGQFFKSEPTLSLDNPAWMTLTNASVQYVAATRPGKTEPQLVKRMHYVSFVGMFRSDLFEGLCVGHAPKKCPICGRWFLTIDARHTKYCGGLAPGDQRGRTCRQIGNLRGREQRELADDHPIKAIYTRRMNTILQSTRRGKLDEGTAAAMKKLAKDKMLRALSDQRYASTVYEQEMTQDALLEAVKKK